MHVHTGYELIYILKAEMELSVGVVNKEWSSLIQIGSVHISSLSRRMHCTDHMEETSEDTNHTISSHERWMFL